MAYAQQVFAMQANLVSSDVVLMAGLLLEGPYYKTFKGVVHTKLTLVLFQTC